LSECAQIDRNNVHFNSQTAKKNFLGNTAKKNTTFFYLCQFFDDQVLLVVYFYTDTKQTVIISIPTMANWKSPLFYINSKQLHRKLKRPNIFPIIQPRSTLTPTLPWKWTKTENADNKHACIGLKTWVGSQTWSVLKIHF